MNWSLVKVARGVSANLFAPVLNISARLVGMSGRLGLTVYMAKYLPLDQIGLFGLISGVAGLMPSVSGLGLNFFLSRELVDKSEVAAGVLIRDRLIVTILVQALFGVAFFSAGASGLVTMPTAAPLISLIVFLETIGFDLHMSLISLRRSVLANALLSLRSGVWVFPAVALGVLHPSWRNLECVLYSWLAGLLSYYVILILAFRNWPIKEIAAIGVQWAQSFGAIRRGLLIYASDIGLAGSLYLDRYIVAHFLGLNETGLYTLYWTVANGIHMLITAAILQPSTPEMITALRRGEEVWLSVFRHRFGSITLAFLPLSVAVFVVAIYGLPHFGISRLSAQPALFAMLLGAVLMRLYADNMNSALYTRHLDRLFSIINLAGLGVAFAAEYVLLLWFGMLGAGLAMLTIPLLLIGARFIALQQSGILLEMGAARRNVLVR